MTVLDKNYEKLNAMRLYLLQKYAQSILDGVKIIYQYGDYKRVGVGRYGYNLPLQDFHYAIFEHDAGGYDSVKNAFRRYYVLVVMSRESKTVVATVRTAGYVDNTGALSCLEIVEANTNFIIDADILNPLVLFAREKESEQDKAERERQRKLARDIATWLSGDYKSIDLERVFSDEQ